MASIIRIRDAAALNTYLVKHLKPLTEVDPYILAKYIWALLKNNTPKAELEALCTEKLADFLGEDSKTFVLNLFHALEAGTDSTRQEEIDSKMEDGSVPMPVISVVRATPNEETLELKSSSQLGRHSEANSVGSVDHEEQGSDDEDDDRNHKHKRRVERSYSIDRVTQDGPLQKRSRSDDGNPSEEFHRGPNFLEKDGLPKRRLSRDHVSGAAIRFGIDANQRGLSWGASIMRNDGLGSRFEHQNDLSRGLAGRGRGGSPFLVGSREQRAIPVDPSGNKGLMMSSVPSKNLYTGRSSSSWGNPSPSPWLGYNLFTGMTNGSLDHPLPLNPGMPGSRVVSMSPAVGVGMNIGVGIALRPRCPDFEERGYCLRGDLCPMEHGANRIVVEDVQSLSKFNLPVVLPSGCGMGLGTVPVSSSSLDPYSGVSNIAPRDVNASALMDSSFSKVGSGSYIGTEPDLYDPDQPLWNKEQPAPLVDSLGKLPPFRKDSELQSSALEKVQRQSPEDEAYGRPSVTLRKSQSMGSTQSVWNRIGCVDQGDTKDSSFPLIAESSMESSQSQKVFKRETHASISSPGKREIDFDERSLKTSKSAAGKAGDRSTAERDHNIYKAHGGRGWRFPSERAHNTLYIGGLPSNPNRKDLLVAHFQKFGDIVDIRVPAHGERAFVQFLRHEEAEAALTSPEAVMGNRFIRLSWAKRDSVPFSSMEGITALPPVAQVNSSRCVDVDGLSLDSLALIKGKNNALLEANKNKQASKLGTLSQSNSTQKKQEELEHMKETMEAIRKRQEELDRKRDEFRRRLERISKQGNDTASDLEVDSLRGAKGVSLEETSNKEEKEGMNCKSIHKQTSFTSVPLEKVLSVSDQGVQDLKKDPDKQSLGLSQVPSGPMSQHSPKGVRGHSLWPSPGVTGSQWPAASRYKIDNRTTVFRVLSPLPDSLLDATVLKHHFQFFGGDVNVEREDLDQQGELLSRERTTAKVAFSTRSAAEKAFVQGKRFQGTTLHFTWVYPPNASLAASSENVQVEGKTCGLKIEKDSQDGQSSQTLLSASGNGLDAEGGIEEVDGQLKNNPAAALGTVLAKASEDGNCVGYTVDH